MKIEFKPYTSHHRELLNYGECINCGERDRGITEWIFNPEDISWHEQIHRQVEKQFTETGLSEETIEQFKKVHRFKPLEYITVNGKKGLVLRRMLSRESSYLSAIKHWDCKSSFTVKEFVNDFDPSDLPSWDAWNEELDNKNK